MEADIAVGVEDAQVHFSGMKIDSTVVFVRLGIESHEASFGEGFRQSRAYPKGGVRPKEALHSIPRIHRTEIWQWFSKNVYLIHRQVAAGDAFRYTEKRNMLFLQFECIPLPDAPEAKEIGGAFVNCWINELKEDEAESIATETLRNAGWEVVTLEECYPISRENYADGHSPEGLKCLLQAEIDGSCYAIHAFPKEDDEDSV